MNNNVLNNHSILGLVNSVKTDKKLIIRLRRQIKYHIVKDDRPAPKQKQSLESILNKTLEFNAYLVWTERWPLFRLNCCKIKLWKLRSKMEYHKPYSGNGSSLGVWEQISAIDSVNI